MRVHNLMLDLVTQKVEEFQSSLPAEARLDEASQADMVCFVLNRIPPLYVVSGRGLAHTETREYTERAQRLADITTLVKQAYDVIERNRRQRSEVRAEDDLTGPWFNFPSIIGRLFYGENFTPVSGVRVALYHNGELMRVLDPNWQNPYEMVPNTAGTFLFWPYPVRAESAGQRRSFALEIRVDAPGYDPLRYGFTLELVSETAFVDFATVSTSHRLRDLYLFPSD